MWRDYLRLSWRSVGHRKKRSWLTIIGIVIGIAAVVALISLGQALQAAVNRQFEQFGVNLITIQAGDAHGFGGFGNRTFQIDLETVRAVEGVERIGTMLAGSAYVRTDTIEGYLRVFGMSPGMPEVFGGFEVEQGRTFAPDDGTVVILGHRVAQDLNVGVGDQFTVEDRPFTVIGLLKESNPQNDDGLFVPLTTLQQVFQKPGGVSAVLARVAPGREVSKVAEAVEESLQEARGRDDLQVRTSEQFRDLVNNALVAVQGFLGGIAAISLLVGGIGVMNTMYTAVLERTREIGVMKAVGAKRRQISTLFLIESGIMGLVGGAIGVVLGLFLSNGILLIAKRFVEELSMLGPVLSPGLIVGALAFSYLIGTLSGYFPARNAAKLQPVEALRYE